MQIKNKLRHFVQLQRQNIKYPELMDNYEWADTWRQADDIIRHASTLRRELKVLNKKSCRGKLIEALRESYRYAQNYRLRALARALQGMQEEGDVSAVGLGKYWEHAPSWEDIEAAAGMVEFEISDEDHEEAVRSINAELDEMERLLDECTPDERFDEANSTDKWETFREGWLKVQTQILEPCNPLGIHLNHSSQAEQEAWLLLGIKSAQPAVPDTRNSSPWAASGKSKRSLFGNARFHAA